VRPDDGGLPAVRSGGVQRRLRARHVAGRVVPDASGRGGVGMARGGVLGKVRIGADVETGAGGMDNFHKGRF
jgi:hypothetical protein